MICGRRGGGPDAAPEAGRGLEHPRAAAGDGHKIQPEVARIQVGFLFSLTMQSLIAVVD